jgi:hypothetical protein
VLRAIDPVCRIGSLGVNSQQTGAIMSFAAHCQLEREGGSEGAGGARVDDRV